MNLLLAFVVVLALIGVIAWAIRRFTRQRLGSAARTRQPRLAIIDTAAVDARRQLVIIRRDNVEHLLMIGGASDVVIETNIVRASPATAGRDSAARAPNVLDAPRTSPVYEGTSWPAPQPETGVRLQRSYPLDEPAQWQAPVQPEPTSRDDKSAAADQPAAWQPPVRQEPSLRTPQTSTGPIRPPQADRAVSHFEPDMRSAAPPSDPPAVSAAQPAAPPANVAARLGGRMEAPPRAQAGAAPVSERRPEAGPRFSFPSLKADRAPSARAVPPPVKVDRPGANPTGGASALARGEPKPRGKTLYESLEQEMASLLGKPPGKS